MTNDTIDLRDHIERMRKETERSLEAAESGLFKIYSVEASTGEEHDHLPEHIASLRRIIAEYDQILATLPVD